MGRRLVPLVLIVVGLGAYALACTARSSASSPPEGDVHARASAFFATQPEYFQPLADTPPPTGLQAMDTSVCVGCHPSQVTEWRDSIHARAWDDDQYQAELNKDPGIRWICINCHLPLYDSQPELPVGLEDGDLRRPQLEPNPTYSEALRDDAIGCAACHVRDGHVEGPTGEAPGAPHATRRSANLTDSEFCIRCHGVEVRVEQLDLVCAFATGREWSEWSQGQDPAPTCQSCHMPQVEHQRWVGAPVAPGSLHAFPGSLIPKRPSDAEAFEARQAQFPEGLSATVSFEPQMPRRGQRAELVVTLTNDRAGHSVPTGDPERYVEALIRIGDARGNLIAERVEISRAKFAWHPTPKLEYDNRITAGETRTYRIPFDVGDAQGLVGEVQVYKYRIDEEALKYHHLEDKVVAGRRSGGQKVLVPTGP
jgi:hypothetical protein